MFLCHRGMSFDPTNEPYQISVAPEAVEVGKDRLVLPGGVLLPLSVRGSGVPGMLDRPWSHLTADVFYTNLPPQVADGVVQAWAA